MKIERQSQKQTLQQTDVSVSQITPFSEGTIPAQSVGKLGTNNSLAQSSNLLMMQRQFGNQAVRQMVMQRSTKPFNIDSKKIKQFSNEEKSEEEPSEKKSKLFYTNNFTLHDNSGQQNLFLLSDFKISRIKLPVSYRPPTKFGKDQKAHSISWTLLKQAYESVNDMNAKDFVEKILKEDWASLREQKKFYGIKMIDKEDIKYAEFNKKLEKYSDKYFQQLLEQKQPSYKWVNIIQKMISNYFIALQLAPLTTHAAIKGTQSSHSGEAASNKKLREIEKQYNVSDTTNQKDDVLKAAARYWDPGKGRTNGIDDDEKLSLLKKEYTVAFQRVYKKIWEVHKDDIESMLSKEDLNQSKKIESKSKKLEESEDELEELLDLNANENSSEFEASIYLQEGNSANKMDASAFKIKSLSLSNDRPQTKYGILGQKSHTVSWSLTRNSLTKKGEEIDVTKFLEYMKEKWEMLKDQDWKSMIDSSDKLISEKELKKKWNRKTIQPTTYNNIQIKNKNRLKTAHLLIHSNIEKINNLLQEPKLSELEWYFFIQEMISDYIVAYQSAPLTTRKDGKPNNKGEQDANTYLKLAQENLSERELAENEKKNSSNNDLTKYKNHKVLLNKFYQHFEAKRHYNKMSKEEQKNIDTFLKQDKTTLTLEQWDTMIILLSKGLAIKHLDIDWNAFNNIQTSEEKKKYMSMILYEWEQKIKDAYPLMAEYISSFLSKYSDNMNISEGMKETDKDHTMRESMKLIREKYKLSNNQSLDSANVTETNNVDIPAEVSQTRETNGDEINNTNVSTTPIRSRRKPKSISVGSRNVTPIRSRRSVKARRKPKSISVGSRNITETNNVDIPAEISQTLETSGDEIKNTDVSITPIRSRRSKILGKRKYSNKTTLSDTNDVSTTETEQETVSTLTKKRKTSSD